MYSRERKRKVTKREESRKQGKKRLLCRPKITSLILKPGLGIPY